MLLFCFVWGKVTYTAYEPPALTQKPVPTSLKHVYAPHPILVILFQLQVTECDSSDRDYINYQPTKLASNTARYSSSNDGTKCCPFLLPSPSMSLFSSNCSLHTVSGELLQLLSHILPVWQAQRKEQAFPAARSESLRRIMIGQIESAVQP